MAVLSIVKYPHEVLKRTADPVTDFGEELKTLVNDMIETMRENDGVGLAAPQVGRSLQLFIASPQGGKKGKVHVFINPELTLSDEKEYGPEGCLSVPGVYNDVERARTVTVQFSDMSGDRHELKTEGFLARIIQHENDHLRGTLFIDRLAFSERKTVLDEYKRLQHISM